MTVTKESPLKRIWVHFAQLAFVVAGIGAFVAFAGDWIGLASALVVFGVAVVCSIALSEVVMRTYTCPQCRGWLEAPKGWRHRFAGRTLLLRCASCRINWDFGLRGHED